MSDARYVINEMLVNFIFDIAPAVLSSKFGAQNINIAYEDMTRFILQ